MPEPKKAVVTGASRGLGKAIAEKLLESGVEVLATYASCAPKEQHMDWVQADFSQEDSLQHALAVIKRYEPDILVNNAGINKVMPFSEISLFDWCKIQQVNLTAPFLFCQTVLPPMKRKNWGRIINISSIWGKISKAGRAAYSASKFALDGMTAALAAEEGKNGILANCVSPGFIDTDLTRQSLSLSEIEMLVKQVPLRRLGTIEEVSALVVWLCSEQNTFISGQNIAIDGGFSRV